MQRALWIVAWRFWVVAGRFLRAAPGYVAECHVADSVYAVSVLADNTRLLWDKRFPDYVETNAKCAGEAPRGKGDCLAVRWPCRDVQSGDAYGRATLAHIKPICAERGSWRAFFVGLGGGAMQSELLRACPDAVIETYEIAPGIVPVAENAMGFVTSASQRLTVADARTAAHELAHNGTIFDLIMSDYSSLHDTAFLRNVSTLLRPGGVLAYSSYNPFPQQWLHEVSELFGVAAEPVATADNNLLLLTTPA